MSPNDSLQPAARRASTLTIRRFTPDEWWLYRDLRLRALQDSPDAFGSTYAQECQRTDSDWGARLARGATSRRDLPLLAEVNGEPGGLAWVRIEEDALSVAHLYQMWVAPDRRGQGVGRALLDAAVEWARTAGTHALMLDVTVSNGPALHLYERAGFVAIGDPKPLRPGSTLQSRLMQLSFTSGSAKASDAERCLQRSRD